nr:hypothetical protein [Tanacetum cinerariifolium]
MYKDYFILLLGAAGVDVDVFPATADEPSIPSPTRTTQPPPPSQELPSTSQGEIIANKDADEDVTLKDVAAVAKEVEIVKDAEIKENTYVQGRQAESQAQIYKIALEHADMVLSMKDDELEPAEHKEVFANMRHVGKGFSGVDTPLFKGMIVAQQADDVADEGAAGVDVDVVPAIADEPSIPSPTRTTQPPPPSQELPSTSQVEITDCYKISSPNKDTK